MRSDKVSPCTVRVRLEIVRTLLLEFTFETNFFSTMFIYKCEFAEAPRLNAPFRVIDDFLGGKGQ